MPAPGTDTALAHWLRALGSTTGAERAWIAGSGAAVVVAAERSATATLATLAGEGVHLAGSDAAAALAAVFDATPHSLPAPGVLIGDLLVTAATVLEPEVRSGAPTPADPGQRVEAALDATAALVNAAPSLLPLLAFAPPRAQFVVASAFRLDDIDDLDDATPATRAALAAATLDDQLVALGLRPARPAPRQLATIATIVAATLAIGDSLDRKAP
jgi:hypothetical protein